MRARSHTVIRSICLTAALVAVPALAQGAMVVADAASPALGTLAQGVPVGGALMVEGVDLDLLGPTATLELTRFQVFAPEARIVVHRPGGDVELAVPDNAYFRGSLAGEPASRAFLSVQATGETRGIVTAGGRFWVMQGGDRGLAVAQVDSDALAEQVGGFNCSTGDLHDPREMLRVAATPPAQAPARLAQRGVPGTYAARVAIETDNEFLSLFGGDAVDATNYVADVIGFGSGVYNPEVDTDLLIVHLSLWDGVTDPWTQFSTVCGLFEFGRYWNDNHSGIFRTIAHFMSGKSNGGGVAWVGVLCEPEFDYDHGGACPALTPQTDNYGGGYGYSGDLDANFDINSPTVVWDIVVTSHEIGHNFDSPHTHCYAGLQGNASPVDMCYGSQAGCYSGATSLPSGCPGGGMGCGTIMSYCHLLGGGIANITMTFGEGHPWGVAPERVGMQMSDHISAVFGSTPACLDSSLIFTDGFESGNTTLWTSQTP